MLDKVYHINGVAVTLKELLKTWEQVNHGPWLIQKQREKHPGLQIVDNLERELADAWERATRRIAQGQPPALALSDYEAEAAALFEAYYRDAFLAGLEKPDDGGLVAAAIALAETRLAQFMITLYESLSGLNPAEAEDLMNRRKSRALMYAGGAWGLYNRGLIFQAPSTSIWEWFGPLDQASCLTCIEEVEAGPRPLSEITRFPAISTECLSRCRHILRRRKDLE